MCLFNILGPPELLVDGAFVPWPGEGSFQDTLLIALLTARGKVIPTHVLAQELWGQALPASPANALQAHVSRLRRKLRRIEPDRPAGRLVLVPRVGYRLDALDDEVDAHVFLAGAARLERDAATARPDQVVAAVARTLALWRGPVLGGIVGGPLCQESARLHEEARLRILEIRFDAELALGRHGAVIGELGELVSTPSSFRERYCEQLMTALYRSGRKAEALDFYRLARAQVEDTAGAEPSWGLRDHERAVLEHDAILDGPRRVRPKAASRPALVGTAGHRPSEGGRSFRRR
jgi:DNA-binding SARP family transcriptional activator